MVTIYLHDTGLLTTTSSTSLSGSGNIANNGVEIPLKIRTVVFSVGLGFDDAPQPGSFARPRLAFVSIPAPMLTLTGQINKKGDVSSSTNTLRKIVGDVTPTLTDESGSSTTDEVKMLGLLEHASRTKGYKELYYKDSTADNIFFGIATDTETANNTYKTFFCRIKSLTITDNPNSKLITWNCTLEVTR